MSTELVSAVQFDSNDTVVPSVGGALGRSGIGRVEREYYEDAERSWRFQCSGPRSWTASRHQILRETVRTVVN